MRSCPFCHKEVQDNAQKCRHCGAWFTDDAEAKQQALDREEAAKKLVQNKKDGSDEALGENTQCFSVSTQKMVVMSFLSFGLYELYWFYRNWREIMIQEDRKIRPFWRTFFAPFYCYAFFKRIMDAAVKRGYKTASSPGVLALVYIIMIVIANRAPAPFDMIGLISFIPILYVNKAIRFINFAIDPQYQERQKLTGGEIGFVIVGLLFWMLMIASYVLPEPAAQIY